MNEPKLIFEHPDFLALNKPAGLLVHPARHARQAESRESKVKSLEPTLVDWILARYPQVAMVGDDPAERPGIVHRLDKDTSGVILIALTQESFLYLKSLFQKREIQKTYLAWVLGRVEKAHGVIDTPIGIKNGTIKRSTRSAKMRKEAVTEYRFLKEKRKGDDLVRSLLEVSPHTGRTHQIRVHLASIGHPIVGDVLYGKKTKQYAPRLMLHALSLEFRWKDGAQFHLEAEPSAEFSNTFQ